MRKLILVPLMCLAALTCTKSGYAQLVDSLQHPEFFVLHQKAIELYQNGQSYEVLSTAEKMTQLTGEDSLQIAIVHYLKGAAHTNLRNQEEAYPHLLHALNYFQRVENLNFLPQVYGDLALLRFYREDYEGSLKYYRKALDIFREQDNKQQEYRTKGNIGIIHANSGDSDKAIAAFKEVVQLANQEGDIRSVVPGYMNIGQQFIRLDEPDSAMFYLETALELCDQHGFEMHKADIYNSVSGYFFIRQDYDSSYFYGDKAETLYREYGRLKPAMEMLHRMASAKEELGDREKAVELLWEHISLKDSIYSEEKERAVAEAEAKFMLSEKENNIRLLEAQNKADNRKLWLYLVLFFLTVVIVFAVIIKLRNEKKLRQKEKLIHSKELELETAHKQRLQDELDLKIRSLTKEGLRIIQKNKQLEDLQSRLDVFGQSVPTESKQELRDIRSSIKYAFSVDKDWKEFSVYFEEVHPSFMEDLTRLAPQLTTKEKRLCALLKVGMSTKEIASVLGISPDSVKKARNRLRKKLGLDVEQDLNTFLQDVNLVRS